MQSSQQGHRVSKTCVEFGLKSRLNLSVCNSLPRIHRFPDEHDRDLTRPRVVEPDFFGQKRNSFEPVQPCLTQSPDVMVDAQELIEMNRVNGEDEYFDGQSFG
ncbi:MAG: hypothetical protein RLZ37_215 [Actinomycetota bacterium]